MMGMTPNGNNGKHAISLSADVPSVCFAYAYHVAGVRKSAFSRARAMDVGLTVYESMKSRYGIEAGVEHYACVLDMLERAGMVECDYDFISIYLGVSFRISCTDHTLNQYLILNKT
ncbi:hypothetical protein L1987_24917 [Smallanthus sonchifolius]|uniref:Uncharacterized protein n=1 Tax=Smallanthus sonchifolius TaxID=185202 RepID=A0ACB9ILY1_9ASTR|nr:hypothetical protein L1987_24917 [Smallanthus sonchifolius]